MRAQYIGSSWLMLLVVVSSGCSVWTGNVKSKKDDQGWSISKLWKKEYQQPNAIAAIWSPDVLSLPGKPPTRGFGGRIYFYNDRSQAVPVEGELIVHGYRKPAGQRRESQQVAADKTFAFTAEQLTGHFSPSEMGASYSIWIPWDAADGLREEVTLIPTFKSKTGTLVQGTPAKVYLPGRSLEHATEGTLPSPLAVQSVSYEKSTIPTNNGVNLPKMGSGLRTTTIEVPASASLVGRRNSTGLEAYTLGGAGNSEQFALSQERALKNFELRRDALQNSTDLPRKNSATLPETGSESAPQVKPLSPPPSLETGPRKSPIAHQPWNTRLP